MAGYAGTLLFNTKINDAGFSTGASKLGNAASKALKVAGLAVAGFTAYSIKVGADFEAGMSKVAAISGATGKEFERLREEAQRLGQETKFSATESAEAMAILAQAGFNTNEIMDATAGVLSAAAAGGIDLATSADITASTLRGFGLEAEKASHVSDVLALSASRTNTNITATGEAFKYVAPMAKAVGMSVEETAAAIGVLSNAGIKGSMAGTVLRGALTRLINPTTEAQESLNNLGVEIVDAQGNMLPFATIVDNLKDKTAGLTQEQRNQALSTIFGQRAVSGMLALMDSGGDTLRDFTQQYVNADGAAKEMAETMNNNLKGKVTILKSSFEALGIAAYDTFKGPLKDAVDVAIKAINKLTRSMKNGDLSDSFGKMAKAMANAVKVGVNVLSAALPALIKCLGWISDHGSLIVASIMGISGAFAVLKVTGTATSVATAGAMALEVAISALTGKITLMTAAQEMANIVTMANPYTLVATAVVALGAALGGLAVAYASTYEETNENVKQTQELIDKHEELTQTIKDHKKAQEEAIESAGTEAAAAKVMADRLDELSKKTNKTAAEKELMKYYVDELNKVMPELNLQYDAEADKLSKSTEEIYKNIEAMKQQAIADAYRENMKEIAQDYAKAELGLAEAKKAEAKASTDAKANEKQLATIREEAKKKGDSLMSTNTKLGQKYFDLNIELGKNLESQRKAGEEAKKYESEIKKLDESLTKNAEAYGSLTSASNAAWAALVADALKGGTEVPASVSAGIESGMYAVPESIDELKALISYDDMIQNGFDGGYELPDSIAEGIASGETKPSEALKRIQKDLKQINDNAVPVHQKGGAMQVSAHTRGMQSQAKNPVNVASSIRDGSIAALDDNGWAYKKGNNASSGFTNGIKALSAAAINHARKTAGDVNAEYGRPNYYQSGSNAGSGFANGISGSAALVRAAAANIAAAAKAQMDKTLNSRSPSREMIKRGKWFDQGFVLGIQRESKNVENAASNLANTALDAMSPIQKVNLFDGINLDGLRNATRSISNRFVQSALVPSLSGTSSSGTTTINYNQTNTFTSTGALKPSEQALEMRNAMRKMRWENK